MSAHPWIAYTLEIAAMILGAWLFRALVIRQLRRVSRRTRTALDDALVAILDRAITPILVVAIVAASLNLFTLPANLLHVANRTVAVVIIAILLYYGSKVLQLFLNAWLNRRVERESLREPIRFASQVLFAALAVMIILDNLGISLTAVSTTLGVGSVAVALALQDS